MKPLTPEQIELNRIIGGLAQRIRQDRWTLQNIESHGARRRREGAQQKECQARLRRDEGQLASINPEHPLLVDVPVRRPKKKFHRKKR